MKSEIQVSHLKTLMAIHEEGGFAAAARRVSRTQSAVTQQMQTLEQIVGVPLFIAKGRQRELTTAGKTLLRHGREIISLCNHAVSAASRSQHTGVVKVGAPQEVAEELLPVVLSRMAELWPDIRVIVHAVRSPELMQMLDDGQLDLTISTRLSKNYDSALLVKLPVRWIAAPEWKRDVAAPLPLVLSDAPSMFRRIALSALDISGLSYVERVTSPSLAGVRLAVSAGLGVTARTQSSFMRPIQMLTEQQNLPPLPDISYHLHRPLSSVNPPASDLFELLLEEAESNT